MHPDHSKELISLKRIEGQMRGIRKMIEEKKYCIDILTQVRSARKALLSTEERILKRHITSCVGGALKTKSEVEVNKKLEEILNLVKKFMG
jgi:CsoR family transcriptional regulator, copper-sensing transcriptional repressor